MEVHSLVAAAQPGIGQHSRKPPKTLLKDQEVRVIVNQAVTALPKKAGRFSRGA